MINTLETGAVFKLIDEFSRPGAKLFDVLERADKQAKELQLQLDKISLGTAVKTIDAQWKEISAINDRGVAGIISKFDGIAKDVEPAWAKVVAGADGAFDSIVNSGSAFKREMISTLDSAGSEAAKAMATSLDAASAGMFTPVVGAARSAAAEVSAIMAGVSREIEAAGRSGAASTWANSNASLGTRKAAAHGVHGAHANGLHFGRIGGHIGGSHVSAGGDGLIPAVAGFGILDVMAHATEGAMEMRHWKSQFQAANFSPEEIGKAESAAWANAMRNPNVSATDNLKALYEMVKVFPEVGGKGPGIGEAIDMLPSFTDIMTGLESVKAEGIHSKFAEGKQIYDLAKGLEETGVTQRGATVEERLKNTRHMEMELFKTMLSERGVTDGTQFYQMTNNSKGASQNWDERMATVVAPILGSVMRHSKMGNADYMVLKTFQAGRADSKTVEGLVNAGLLNEDIASGMAWQDKKKNWHLEANNAFARGSEKNLWDWSGRQLDVWKGQGVNINDQEAINAKINQIGANASTTTMLRALLEPSTRSQIGKDMWARDQIGDNALGILKDNDPVLKIGALEKSLSNFFASFGAGLVDPAIAGLTALTSGLNALSKAMESHPDLAKFAAENAAVAGAGLLGFGGAKMLGLLGGGLDHSAVALNQAAVMLQEAAIANGAKGVGGTVLNGAEKIAPGLPIVGLGLPLFGAGMFVTEALLNRDQSKALIDGGHPDVKPWDNNLGLPGVDTLPEGFHPSAYRSGDGEGMIETLAQGVFRGLVLYANGGGAGGTGGGGGGIVNASWTGGDIGSSSAGGYSGGARAGRSLGSGGGWTPSANDPVFTGAKDASGFDWSRMGVQMGGKAAYLGAHLQANGASEFGAAAMLGHASVESNFKVDAYNGRLENSHGLFQWNDSALAGHRWSKLMAWARTNGRNPNDPLAQLDYAKTESMHMRGPGGRSVWDAMQHAGSLSEANRIWMDYFENPKVKDYGNRLGAGERVLHAMRSMGHSVPHERSAKIPTASAPPRRVSPAVPPGHGEGRTMAALQPVHTHIHLDGRKIARSVTNHQVAMMEFPNAIGGPDTYGSHQGPGTPLNDAA